MDNLWKFIIISNKNGGTLTLSSHGVSVVQGPAVHPSRVADFSASIHR